MLANQDMWFISYLSDACDCDVSDVCSADDLNSISLMLTLSLNEDGCRLTHPPLAAEATQSPNMLS